MFQLRRSEYPYLRGTARFDLWRGLLGNSVSILAFGVANVVGAAIGELPPIILLAMDLNDPMNLLLQPYVAPVMAICATRMYRDLCEYAIPLDSTQDLSFDLSPMKSTSQPLPRPVTTKLNKLWPIELDCLFSKDELDIHFDSTSRGETSIAIGQETSARSQPFVINAALNDIPKLSLKLLISRYMGLITAERNGRHEIPGGDRFIDARAIFEDGVKDINEGELVVVDGFDLNDAMAAIEIMDDRMDSGRLPEAPPFDPNTSLLPEEVCWILDRTFAAELQWHNGFPLSQTVLTIRYVHYLMDISTPKFKTSHDNHRSTSKADPDRPPELVNLVLRAGIFGVVKSCDLVWRELAQNRVVEGEDWSSEKFGVSFCENVQPEKVVSLLGDALNWLHKTSATFPSFPVLRNAKQDLVAILSGLTPPEPSFEVLNTIDPNIMRQLMVCIPMRDVSLPSYKETWAAWKLLAEMRAYEDEPYRRTAFLRSFTSSTFFDGTHILLTHGLPWLVDRFFHETAAIPQGLLPDGVGQLTDTLLRSFNNDSNDNQFLNDELTDQLKEGVDQFEKMMGDLLVDLFTSFYHNRARQRRLLAGSLLGWHVVYERAKWIISYLKMDGPFEAYARVPLCIRYMRLMIIAQVVLSGFELELYARSEWAMMYWYLAEVLTVQNTVLSDIHSSLLRETKTSEVKEAIAFINTRKDYVQGLQGLASTMRDMLFYLFPRPAHIDLEQEQANFQVRFKWAFIKEYSDAQELDEDKPILGKWRRWCLFNESRSVWKRDAMAALRESKGRFTRLATRHGMETSSATLCMDEYHKFLENLGHICDMNIESLAKMPDGIHNGHIHCSWERSKWFPVLAHSMDNIGSR
ncbi:hypothetical protein Clacol_006078 [Clathrus columnatus]|uniref:Uncharacterized protein n=1 Tax=Clathrus columnatus TaxID=1419009 RepID=A0AAV5AG13_9AGAM|nr:hypothetical protein Clacol_006078 [Clathrus columnatus]